MFTDFDLLRDLRKELRNHKLFMKDFCLIKVNF